MGTIRTLYESDTPYNNSLRKSMHHEPFSEILGLTFRNTDHPFYRELNNVQRLGDIQSLRVYQFKQQTLVLSGEDTQYDTNLGCEATYNQIHFNYLYLHDLLRKLIRAILDGTVQQLQLNVYFDSSFLDKKMSDLRKKRQRTSAPKIRTTPRRFLHSILSLIEEEEAKKLDWLNLEELTFGVEFQLYRENLMTKIEEILETRENFLRHANSIQQELVKSHQELIKFVHDTYALVFSHVKQDNLDFKQHLDLVGKFLNEQNLKKFLHKMKAVKGESVLRYYYNRTKDYPGSASFRQILDFWSLTISNLYRDTTMYGSLYFWAETKKLTDLLREYNFHQICSPMIETYLLACHHIDAFGDKTSLSFCLLESDISKNLKNFPLGREKMDREQQQSCLILFPPQ